MGINGGNGIETIKLEPVEHILGGCQIAIIAERNPLTGQTYKELQAFHPSGHVYKLRFPLDSARQIGRALIKDVTHELDAAGVTAPTPLRDSLKQYMGKESENDSE